MVRFTAEAVLNEAWTAASFSRGKGKYSQNAHVPVHSTMENSPNCFG
jgi:hypothetical protein